MPETTASSAPLYLDEIEEIRQRLTIALAAQDITHGLARVFRATLKELELYGNHAISRQRPTPIAMRTAHPCVQVGGGRHQIEGFFNIDIVAPADLIWDVRESLPLPDESVEVLFSEHFLEHIDYPRSVKHHVAEVHRVLAPGGHAIYGVPDAAVVLRGYHDDDQALFAEMRERWYGRRNCQEHFNTSIDLVNYVFRDQDDDEQYTPHLWAYDYEKLASLFTGAGFGHVGPWTFDPSLANAEREWSSRYVIATK